MKIRKVLSVILAIASLASLQGATIIGDVADAVASDRSKPADGIGNTTADPNKVDLRVGTFGGPTETNNYRNAPIFVFQLPTLGVGESLSSADFRVYLASKAGIAGSDYNVDLWALRVSESSTVLASDYGAGPTPSGPAGQTLLQADFIQTSSAGASYYTTNAGANTTLTSFINSNYSNGGFLFIRANADSSIDFGSNASGGTISQGYDLIAANNSTNRPELVIAVIPEPSTLILLLIAGVSTLILRRRHRG